VPVQSSQNERRCPILIPGVYVKVRSLLLHHDPERRVLSTISIIEGVQRLLGGKNPFKLGLIL
jgi:hypothetical protein